MKISGQYAGQNNNNEKNNNYNDNKNTGALGVIKKKTEDHIKRIPGNPCLQELQNVVLNGMAHLLRRVLSIWLTSLFLQIRRLTPS